MNNLRLQQATDEFVANALGMFQSALTVHPRNEAVTEQLRRKVDAAITAVDVARAGALARLAQAVSAWRFFNATIERETIRLRGACRYLGELPRKTPLRWPLDDLDDDLLEEWLDAEERR